jgi:hypothetical protein
MCEGDITISIHIQWTVVSSSYSPRETNFHSMGNYINWK